MAWVAIALVPPLVAVAIPALILALTGEFVGPDAAAALIRPGSRPGLYGLAYSNPTNRYKRIAAYAEQRDIVVFGTSRVLQIRREIFRPDTRFYNAGQAVANLNAYAPTIEEWPAATLPKLLIAGMDQYFYNAEWREDEADWTGLDKKAESALTITEKNWRRVWDDVGEKRVPWASLFVQSAGGTGLYGISARVHRAGFRNDGSYRYGRHIAALLADPDKPFDPEDAFDNTLERITRGERRYEFGQAVYPRSLDDTRRFLAAAKARGIEVIGFLPPYAHTVWTHMMQSGDRFEYMRRLPAELRGVFGEFGFALFDYQDLAEVGAGDREAIDGFHPGEKAATRMLLNMAKSHPGLARYVEAWAVEAAIGAAPDPYEVFGD
jgi:hypothetical protein